MGEKERDEEEREREGDRRRNTRRLVVNLGHFLATDSSQMLVHLGANNKQWKKGRQILCKTQAALLFTPLLSTPLFAHQAAYTNWL